MQECNISPPPSHRQRWASTMSNSRGPAGSHSGSNSSDAGARRYKGELTFSFAQNLGQDDFHSLKFRRCLSSPLTLFILFSKALLRSG